MTVHGVDTVGNTQCAKIFMDGQNRKQSITELGFLGNEIRNRM